MPFFISGNYSSTLNLHWCEKICSVYLHILLPFLQDSRKICWQRSFKIEVLFGNGMDESQALRMKCLPWHCVKAITYKAFVLCELSSLTDFITTIHRVIE